MKIIIMGGFYMALLIAIDQCRALEYILNYGIGIEGKRDVF